MNSCKKLGIDIGSTTVKVSIIEDGGKLLFADYKRHFANIQETLADLLREGEEKLGALTVEPVITGSGGLTLSKHLGIPFVQEVVAVATSLKDYAPQTDVAIELGGEDAKIIYFTGGIDQRMNGICAGGTGSFIDQMASLLQTDASGLNEYAKNTRQSIRSRRAAAFSPRRISSLSSTKAQPKRICPPPFSRRLSTRPSAVWHAASRSAAMLHSSAVRFIFSRSCARHLSAP